VSGVIIGRATAWAVLAGAADDARVVMVTIRTL
jgi:hypothetical protein